MPAIEYFDGLAEVVCVIRAAEKHTVVFVFKFVSDINQHVAKLEHIHAAGG